MGVASAEPETHFSRSAWLRRMPSEEATSSPHGSTSNSAQERPECAIAWARCVAMNVHPAPRYPRQAVRAGLEGTVTLRVLVDEQGWPKSVEIERSSGHRELDRSAREHVLAQWRFHPAQRQGRAISAYALVPIEFRLP